MPSFNARLMIIFLAAAAVNRDSGDSSSCGIVPLSSNQLSKPLMMPARIPDADQGLLPKRQHRPLSAQPRSGCRHTQFPIKRGSG